jgi:spermidine/putrescine-binding protein
VPVGNNSRYGAHLWIDYLLGPKVMGKNANWVWYLAPATASHQFTDKFALSLMPTADELQRSETMDDLAEFAVNYSDAWRQVKSA